jgi:hypothetical protein
MAQIGSKLTKAMIDELLEGQSAYGILDELAALSEQTSPDSGVAYCNDIDGAALNRVWD